MENPFRKDISEAKEFCKYGDIFKQVRHNPDTGWWLYERTSKDNGSKHYEVVKGVKYVNPDGSVVFTYPQESRWGVNGYTVPNCWWADKTINYLMGRKTTSAQELCEFKKSLRNAAGCFHIAKIRQF